MGTTQSSKRPKPRGGAGEDPAATALRLARARKQGKRKGIEDAMAKMGKYSRRGRRAAEKSSAADRAGARKGAERAARKPIGKAAFRNAKEAREAEIFEEERNKIAKNVDSVLRPMIAGMNKTRIPKASSSSSSSGTSDSLTLTSKSKSSSGSRSKGKSSSDTASSSKSSGSTTVSTRTGGSSGSSFIDTPSQDAAHKAKKKRQRKQAGAVGKTKTDIQARKDVKRLIKRKKPKPRTSLDSLKDKFRSSKLE